MRHIKYIITGLLDLVVPHCSGCIRPAVKYEGTTFSTEKPTDAKRYACEEHATPEIKWTNLPGAELIRAALAFVSSEDKNDPNERGCPCLHTTPCHPRCTCRISESSSGCRRCCRYGSTAQQSLKATHLAWLQLDHDDLVMLLSELPKCAHEGCGEAATRHYPDSGPVVGFWCDNHEHGSIYGIAELLYGRTVRNALRRFKELKEKSSK